MNRRLTLAILVVAAAGALAVWAVGHYNLGAHPRLEMALGYGSPLVFVLLGYWIARAREREHGGQALPRGARTALLVWFLVACASVMLLDLVRKGDIPAISRRAIDEVFVVLLGASLAWIAWRYYSYRFARPTWRRVILVGLLVALLGIMLYAAYWTTGDWSQFASFFWFFVLIAIFAVLRKTGAGGGG